LLNCFSRNNAQELDDFLRNSFQQVEASLSEIERVLFKKVNQLIVEKSIGTFSKFTKTMKQQAEPPQREIEINALGWLRF
jgi:hypothetical protein